MDDKNLNCYYSSLILTPYGYEHGTLFVDFMHKEISGSKRFSVIFRSKEKYQTYEYAYDAGYRNYRYNETVNRDFWTIYDSKDLFERV